MSGTVPETAAEAGLAAGEAIAGQPGAGNIVQAGAATAAAGPGAENGS